MGGRCWSTGPHSNETRAGEAVSRHPSPGRARVDTVDEEQAERLTRPGRLARGFWAADARIPPRGRGERDPAPFRRGALGGVARENPRSSRGDGGGETGLHLPGSAGAGGRRAAASRPGLARCSGPRRCTAWRVPSAALIHGPRTRSSAAGGGRGVWGGAAGTNGGRGFQRAPEPQPMMACGRD